MDRILWQENSFRIVESENKSESIIDELKERIFGNYTLGRFQEEEEQIFVELAENAGIYDYILEEQTSNGWVIVGAVKGFIGKYDEATKVDYYAYEYRTHEKSRINYIQDFKNLSNNLSVDRYLKLTRQYRKILIQKLVESLRDTPFLNELALNDQETQAFMKEKRKIRTELERLCRLEE